MAHEEEEEDGGSQVSMGLTKLDLCALRGGGGGSNPTGFARWAAHGECVVDYWLEAEHQKRAGSMKLVKYMNRC